MAGVSAAEVRERLVAAAAEVFAERGYDGARTSAIARRAGLSTGAIYSQYGTKAELLLEAINACAPAELDRLFAGDVGESESVLDLVEALAAGLPYKPKELIDLLMEMVAAARRDPAVAEILSDTTKARESIVAGVVGNAQDRGEIDPTFTPRALARLSVTLMLGNLVVQSLAMDPPDRDEWAAVVHRLVHAFEPDDQSHESH